MLMVSCLSLMNYVQPHNKCFVPEFLFQSKRSKNTMLLETQFRCFVYSVVCMSIVESNHYFFILGRIHIKRMECLPFMHEGAIDSNFVLKDSDQIHLFLVLSLVILVAYIKKNL